uniref:Uncharacterized protein n=1 Tax=Oryzias sinensis TaxID=183150 RepID=A0A8C7WP52_9TELE
MSSRIQDAFICVLFWRVQATLCLVSSCPVCSLQKCGLSEVSCAALVPALKSNPSHLKHLNLCLNSLEDSGVCPLKKKLTVCKLNSSFI